MGALRALLTLKIADKIADYIDSKNREPGSTYDGRPASHRGYAQRHRRMATRGRTMAWATAATSIARRNPKLLATAGAAGAVFFLASYLVKRKQQKPTYY